MTMELEYEQTLTPSFGAQQSMKVSPRLVAANHILQLTSQALQQAIATELRDNPALELVDEPTCQVCGTTMQGSICPRCIRRQKVGNGSAADGYSSSLDGAASRGSDDDFDPMTRVASEQTLAEKLMADMGAALPEQDLPIAEYLVGSLDDKGYLGISVEDVAYELAA